jgi:phosphoribosylaminoimidazolecarboxamide formyltransferase/IMP cyclohydrolase
LAQKAFARTASYDAAISNWLADAVEETTPAFRALGGILAEPLRYGENPHQTAAFYRTPERRPGVATARQVQGKELSYNNIADIDAAYECVAEFDPARTAAVAIVKHANPCGVAEGETLLDAYERALACDPVSAFGGIVAFNRPLDGHAARRVVEIFTEAIVAPDATEEARSNRRHPQGPASAPRRRPSRPAPARLAASHRRWRLSRAGARRPPWSTTWICRVVTRRAPTEREFSDLRFAFRVAKHVKSNAIVYAKDGRTVGIGAGQMSRVASSRIAAWKADGAAKAAGLAESLAKGSVVASDAFFPFPDGPSRRGGSGRTGGDPARRLRAGRGGDPGRGRGGAGHGLHGAFGTSGIEDRRSVSRGPLLTRVEGRARCKRPLRSRDRSRCMACG